MRRSTAAAVGTVTGAALIVAVRLSAAAAPVASAAVADPEPGTATAAAGPSPTGTGHPKGATRTGRTGAAHKRAAASSAPASGLRDGTFRGSAQNEPYGVVQVSATIAGGRITGTKVSYPTDGHSADVNGPAVPKLQQETLAAQSATVDTVSGATYTSQAYRQSLQAALDAAHA